MGGPIPVAATIADVRRAVRSARAEGKVVGLVPTMGALHDGHGRLIEECRREADFVVVSIFVNPAQFGPNEDYRRYPRPLDDDLARSASAGAALAFTPTAGEMYPTGSLSTYVEVPGLSDVLEGASRPGHFRGVATVVLKLFQIVGPDLATFGRKDFQQLLVIRRMVADLDVPVRIQAVDTVREADGLALSSRNRYLDPDHRRAARILSEALRRARDAVQGGERDANRVRQILRSTIESEAVARLDYAEVADPETLVPLAEVGPDRPGVALVAARVGPARLIDNAALPG
ncbi:MAG TPA: pantoate--beta-alanine ligase [Isosphaeraceae bacterium]|jgi:pantoate--beta-alanine ligase|nr:pantoate--beta-alanine ligase [Isosphaeraceae bacterium]